MHVVLSILHNDRIMTLLEVSLEHENMSLYFFSNWTDKIMLNESFVEKSPPYVVVSWTVYTVISFIELKIHMSLVSLSTR